MTPITRKLPAATRLLLGLAFLVFGLNGFLQFLPMPPLPGPGGALMGAFAASGYMFPFIKATEVLVGVALLSSRFVPLALVVAAPVTLHIVAFHLFLAPAGLALPLVMLASHLFLGWAYRASFRGVLTAKAEAEVSPVSPRPMQPASAAA